MFKIIPYNPSLVQKAKELRVNMSEPERVMWYQILRNGDLAQYQWKRQQPLLKYIVDFYCPRLLMAVEVDGDSHFTLEQEQYDLDRTTELEKYNVLVLRYGNNDVYGNQDGVFLDLVSKIEERKTVLGL